MSCKLAGCCLRMLRADWLAVLAGCLFVVLSCCAGCLVVVSGLRCWLPVCSRRVVLVVWLLLLGCPLAELLLDKCCCWVVLLVGYHYWYAQTWQVLIECIVTCACVCACVFLLFWVLFDRWKIIACADFLARINPWRIIFTTDRMSFSSGACLYKGNIYQQGQSWDDGCDYVCECVDGATGRYQCTSMWVAQQPILILIITRSGLWPPG